MIDTQQIKDSWMYGFIGRRRDAGDTRHWILAWCMGTIKIAITSSLNRSNLTVEGDVEYLEMMNRILDLVYLDENDILFYTQENP